jgi:hypothetical protein
MAWDRFLAGLLSSRSAQELERAEAEKRRWQRQFSATRRRPRDSHALAERIELLEADVARLSLMAMTLTEVVVRAGLLTREQLQAVAAEIDLLDGKADGMLHPDVLRPQETASITDPSTGGQAAPPTTPPRGAEQPRRRPSRTRR